MLLGIDDLGEDVVGACLQCFHWLVFIWGCTLSLGGIDVLPDIRHVAFFSEHGRRYVINELHCYIGPGGKVAVLDGLE